MTSMLNLLVDTTRDRLTREAVLPVNRKVHSPQCTDTYVTVYHMLEDEGFIEITNLESSRIQRDRFDISFNVIGV